MKGYRLVGKIRGWAYKCWVPQDDDRPRWRNGNPETQHFSRPLEIDA